MVGVGLFFGEDRNQGSESRKGNKDRRLQQAGIAVVSRVSVQSVWGHILILPKNLAKP